MNRLNGERRHSESFACVRGETSFGCGRVVHLIWPLPLRYVIMDITSADFYRFLKTQARSHLFFKGYFGSPLAHSWKPPSKSKKKSWAWCVYSAGQYITG